MTSAPALDRRVHRRVHHHDPRPPQPRALSCFFFHFTNSFRGSDGTVYYGFVTPKGLAVFKAGLHVEIPKDDRYKVGLSDFVHAFMSVMVFVAISFSDSRVTRCLFPGHQKDMDEVMESLPIMVGIFCSTLFLVFPNTRYGLLAAWLLNN